MRRTLALILAVITLAALLASCANVPETTAISPNVRTTSSDAAGAAEWLTGRLGDKLTDRLVIGTGTDGYEVDVCALEDDGYIIRSLGDEIALFAKSENGLDRAARKYAKAVEAGEDVGDETYHEGYRVEKMLFAGVPAGEYAMRVEGENEYIRTWTAKNAAEPFAALIKIACGAEIEFGDAEHTVVFRQIADESFKESSYHYYFSDSDLVFEYTELAGARNAAVKFLENECGWNDLYYGVDDLAEADLIDVPADTDVLCHPRFGGIRLTTLSRLYSYNTLYSVSHTAFTYKYRIESAHHWLGSKWGKEYGVSKTGHIPCLTDEDVFEDIVGEIRATAEDRLDAGEVIGEGFTSINLGAADTNNWCTCKECLKVAKEENYTWAGPMVRFANAVDDALDEAGFDGLKISIFAYAGSNPPPKSSPHDDVYVTFVCDGYCTQHAIDGSQCTGTCLNHVYSIFGGIINGNNNEIAEWIRGWCGIAKHVYVRPAPLSAPFHSYTIIDQLYDEIRFLSDLGVECIYNEIYTYDELDTNLIATELWEAMTFDPDMSRAGYYAEAARLFEKYYGDGWRGAYDYVECLEKTEIENKGCWTAWRGYAFITDSMQNDHALYRELWDRMLSSLADAGCAANCAEQETRIKKLRIAALYGGCYASYYVAYEDRDDARIKTLCERWDEMIALCKDVGIYDGFETLVEDKLLQYEAGAKLIYDSLEDTAWIGGWESGWYNDREEILEREGYDVHSLRPSPEKYD